MSVVITWCGLGIHRFIKNSIASERLKVMHRNVLRMLIYQVIHPALLLLSPSILNFAQLIFNFQLSSE
ncbi:hypothetical protein PMAYCL1PPCAC_15660, partial [Pristionchus mayeri]